MCQTEVPMSITTRLAISSTRPFWRSSFDPSPCAVADPHAAGSLRRRQRQWATSHFTPTTPTAMVVNQDDTTMTTVRLDGKGSPVISTLSLGPVQADAIGGVSLLPGRMDLRDQFRSPTVWRPSTRSAP